MITIISIEKSKTFGKDVNGVTRHVVKVQVAKGSVNLSDGGLLGAVTYGASRFTVNADLSSLVSEYKKNDSNEIDYDATLAAIHAEMRGKVDNNGYALELPISDLTNGLADTLEINGLTPSRLRRVVAWGESETSARESAILTEGARIINRAKHKSDLYKLYKDGKKVELGA